jgi:hypothetical protein
VRKLDSLVEAHTRHVRQQLEAAELAENSQAIAEERSEEVGTFGRWGDEPAFTARVQARLKLIAALDHLNSLQKLLRPPLTLFGLMVLARASVEASSQAYWLLDPALTIRGRVSRSLADRLMSAKEAASVLKLLGLDAGDEVAKIESERNELLAEVVDIPAKTTLAGEVLANHMPNAEMARGLYKLMCASAHSTMYAVLQHFQPIEGSADPRGQLVTSYMPLEAVVWAIEASLGAHTSALDRWLQYVGADRWAWERWKLKLARDLGQARQATVALRSKLA